MKLSLLATSLLGISFAIAPHEAAASAHVARAAHPHHRAGFSAELFKFSVDRPWDGKDGAGGWQKASTTLNFVDARHLLPQSWTCLVTVGMPLRTVGDGPISATLAANLSAEIATDASVNVMHRQSDWIAADYCIEFYKEMNMLFKRRHETVGARVSRL